MAGLASVCAVANPNSASRPKCRALRPARCAGQTLATQRAAAPTGCRWPSTASSSAWAAWMGCRLAPAAAAAVALAGEAGHVTLPGIHWRYMTVFHEL